MFRVSLQSLLERISRLSEESRISPPPFLWLISKYILWANRNQIFNKKLNEIVVQPYLKENTGETQCSVKYLKELFESSADQILNNLEPEFVSTEPTPEELERYMRSLELLLEIKTNALSISIESWKGALKKVFFTI
jgi:hypothetical protein